MGIYATAELIWGIPVQAHDDEGQPTEFWNEDDDDWREFENDLEIHTHGHYEGELAGILTSKRLDQIRAWCGDTKEIYPPAMNVSDKVFSKSNDEARAEGLPVDFYTDAQWWLVSSLG